MIALYMHDEHWCIQTSLIGIKRSLVIHAVFLTMEGDSETHVCAFCKVLLNTCSNNVILTQKGVDGILKASVKRGGHIDIRVGQKVDTKYRQ